MPQATLTWAILFVWLCVMAYVLSVLRMALRVRSLKREGHALEAPDILVMPLEGFRGVVWLITDRYAGLGDEIVTRWSRIARTLFFVSLPMMLTLFAIVATANWA